MDAYIYGQEMKQKALGKPGTSTDTVSVNQQTQQNHRTHNTCKLETV